MFQIRMRAVASFLALALITAQTPAAAQSDILLRLRSGSPLGDRFRVDSAGGVVAFGQVGIGIIPATGCGHRMMWYPNKAAFRAGSANAAGCTYWDDANIGFFSWAGGSTTIASGNNSFAFGSDLIVSAQYGAAFGSSNTVSQVYGFATGTVNLCSGNACVAMGFGNTASGIGSVAIGYRTTADADHSVAIGHRASANGRTGAFVISDASTTDSVEASANNQFSARYAGGYRLYTNASETTGMQMSAGGSSWVVVSNRDQKMDFSDLDGETVLLKLRTVPVTMWRYKDEVDRTVRHIGPMAQDWHAAFGLSTDDKTINMSDLDGVNLAAIQALERRTSATNHKLEAENAELRRRLDLLEAAVQKLTAKE